MVELERLELLTPIMPLWENGWFFLKKSGVKSPFPFVSHFGCQGAPRSDKIVAGLRLPGVKFEDALKRMISAPSPKKTPTKKPAKNAPRKRWVSPACL